MHEDWLLDPDFQLVWPQDLFVKEAREVLRRHSPTDERLALVFEEAFYGEGPKQVLAAGAKALLGVAPSADDPWASPRDPASLTGSIAAMTDKMAVEAFLKDSSKLPSFAAPRPYWGTQAAPAGGRLFDREGVRTAWAREARDFVAKGYLAKIAPPDCVDDHSYDQPDPDERLRNELEERLGWAELWPIVEVETWDDSAFYGAVEVFHDLAARPRRRWWHPFNQCGWHYAEFSISAGQALYRHRINALFARSNTDLTLAETGEDRGRLVRTENDPRNELVERTLRSPTEPDLKQHAIALYRSRDATVEDKRSACIALSGLLEQSRSTLKQELLSKDEKALFQIINQFNIRHRRADQRTDYAPAYLDWVFWWLLATVELLDQLQQR